MDRVSPNTRIRDSYVWYTPGMESKKKPVDARRSAPTGWSAKENESRVRRPPAVAAVPSLKNLGLTNLWWAYTQYI